ncbi:MAG: hypothetical protein RL294_38 [Actinomycetota bacterium]
MAKKPQDRFDDTSAYAGRAGAHRQPVYRRPWWVTTLISGGVIAGIILAALVGVVVLDARNLQQIDISAFGITTTPAPEIPDVDPTLLSEEELNQLTITVLNGTTSATLDEEVAAILTTEGWTSVSTADAADATIEISVVLYGPDEDLPLATSVAESLGIVVVKQSDAYPGAKVTVLVGKDLIR